MTKPEYSCDCGYRWITRKDSAPARCPKCNKTTIYIRESSPVHRYSKEELIELKIQKEKFAKEQEKKGLVLYKGQWISKVWAKQFIERDYQNANSLNKINKLDQEVKERKFKKKGYVLYDGNWISKSKYEFNENCKKYNSQNK